MTEISILDFLACPTCGARMTRRGMSLICPSGHTFDVARAGYVNLLPPGKEKNARTGDEKPMIRARADFLACGHYSRISTRLAELIAQNTDTDSIAVCDMGSGEGHHTLNIAETLGRGYRRTVAFGADASKYGAECASKLSRAKGFMPQDGIGAECGYEVQAYFAPANIFRLPAADGAFDACISMFAPIAWEESRRVLKEGGILAVTSSEKDHLREMRGIIYDDVHEADFSPDAGEGFEKIGEEVLTYPISLTSNKEIRDLFVMTPFYFRTTEEGRERLFSHDALDLTVSVRYTLFRKK